MAGNREQVQTEMVAMRISPALRKRIDRIAKATKRKRSDVMRSLIERGLDKTDKETK